MKSIYLGTALALFSFHGEARNHRDQRIQGIYRVTLENPSAEQNEANQFPVEYKIRRKSDNSIERISYDLPEELTGAENDISFSPSAADPSVWTGNNSDSTCDIDAAQLNCAMTYKNLRLDPVAAQTRIERNVSAPAQFEATTQIMQHFQAHAMGNEPIGHVELVFE